MEGLRAVVQGFDRFGTNLSVEVLGDDGASWDLGARGSHEGEHGNGGVHRLRGERVR